MESTERLVRTWMASGRDEEVRETASEIANGKTTLLNVVKALGEYLTSEEDGVRTKGVEFLSSVLKLCPPEKLNRQSARVLAKFYCSKLEDFDTIIPALKGLDTLTALPSFTEEDVLDTVNAIFKHVRMKALAQNNRFLVFTIIDTLMARHRDVMKNMNDSFISQYVVLAEGEKDPRNLLVAFAIARVVLIEFDIADFVESLHDIVFCYFPIMFRPPPNDPYGITTEELRLALRRCLCATPLFGPLTLPGFLEKLIAGSPAVKQDTLETMSECFPVYGSALAQSNARKLWNALKLEIFQPTDPVTEAKALTTTQDLVKTIYSDNSDGQAEDQEIEGLAKDVCEECITILREPDKSQAKSAIKVLCAFTSTTPAISRYTLSQTVPHLIGLFTRPDDTSSRPSVLLLLSDLISAARDDCMEKAEGSEVALTPYKDELLGILSSGLKTPSSRQPTLACLLGLVSTKNLLSVEEIGFIVHNINEILESDPQDIDDSSSPIIKLLSSITALSPHHIREQTLPLLFGSLPDRAPERNAAADRVKLWRTLSALSTLCTEPELFETFVIRLLTKLDLLCFPAMADADKEPAAAYAHSILTTIYQTVLAKAEDGHADVPKYIESLVPRLFHLFIYSAFAFDNDSVANDPKLVATGGHIITVIVRSLTQQRQESYESDLFSAYMDGNFKNITEGQQKIPPSISFRPFGNSTTPAQRNIVSLFSAAIIGLRKEVKLPVSDTSVFLTDMLDWSLSKADNDLQRTAVWQAISSISNKRAEDALTFLQANLEAFWSNKIVDHSLSSETREHAVKGWIWISKALVVSNHTMSSSYTERLFEVFSDESINWVAAKGFGDIVSTNDILTKQNHAIIKLLYAQKFVTKLLPRIVDGAKDSSKPQEQVAHLVALTSLISSAPKALYSHKMSELIPLLIRGLDLPENAIRVKVIDTFLAVAEGGSPDKSLVSEHAPSLVNTMLKNSLLQEMPSVKVRISALKYLGVIPDIVRSDVLLPLKVHVIKELDKALDDPKRLVRKEAVDARTSWFKLGG
ncbi:ARM repeat-containing protein [Dendrothele bispora CBS 962.96]|uniref:MMS19 nucleotide excision repair protein n=1 Tax=Dendrothele bispora (strain CBS 962.96) TaxID=1314807 RepID=A0A4S8LCB7_DENBC|nr:ARM repeat-containing protein [Dendrothele bispora CBS 962.96]